jgi:hypothetical protein
MARPPSDIDIKHFEELCAYHFTVEEMAAALRLSKRTLLRKIKVDPYKTLWEDGEANGRQLVKRRGFELMKQDNSAGVQAWIHQTKMVLGFSEKKNLELTGKDGGPIRTFDYSKLSDEQLQQFEPLLAALAASGGNAGGDQGGAPPSAG